MSAQGPVGDAPRTLEALLAWQCRHLGPADALDAAAAARLLALLPGWAADGASIVREYRFRDYPATIAFVNAVAAFADAQDHHPELEVGYGRCRVRWSTHSAGGVTVNDLGCAARTDAACAQCAGVQPARGS